ncbi:MAG: cbb3-type cytochrome oxidase assembly protein CcoS [Limisphaerales bacterium]
MGRAEGRVESSRGGRAMIVIFFLIPLSIVMASFFLIAFIWAVRSGQYEDTGTPSMRLLTEDPRQPDSSKTSSVTAGPERVGSPRRGDRSGSNTLGRLGEPSLPSLTNALQTKRD